MVVLRQGIDRRRSVSAACGDHRKLAYEFGGRFDDHGDASESLESLGGVVHSGEILREEFMAPLGLSINALSRDLHVPVTRVSEIVNRRRGISGDTALRLARYFGNGAQFWMNLQGPYEIEVAVRTSGKDIERHVLPREAA